MDFTIWTLSTVSEDFDMTTTTHNSYAEAEDALVKNFLPDYEDKRDVIDVGALMVEHNPTVMWGIEVHHLALAVVTRGA